MSEQTTRVEWDIWRFGQAIMGLRRQVCVNDPEPGRILVSLPLLQAICEVSGTLNEEEPDWRLITALTGVKGYISGPPENCPDAFWEDLPEGYEGESVYGILDGLHFEAAWLAGVMPSGLSTYTANGARHGRVDTAADPSSPTLRRIAEEEARYHV